MTAPSAFARLGGATRREAGFIATSRVMLLALVVVPFCAIAIVAAMLSQGALQALPVAVVDNARTSESQALVRLLSGRPEVRIAAQPVSDAAAEAAMRRGQIWAFVSIPHGFGQPRAAVRGDQCVAEQYGNGHRSNAAGNGCISTGNTFYTLQLDITNAAIIRWMETCIDNHSPGFNPIGFDQLRYAYCPNHDISTLNMRF